MQAMPKSSVLIFAAIFLGPLIVLAGLIFGVVMLCRWLF